MRRSNGRGCWRWDQEKEEGRGQEVAVAKEGGGETWTVSARGDRCPGPSPSGHMGLRDHREALQIPVGPSDPQGTGRILPTLYWAGTFRGWARQHPALPIASPQTHSHTTVLCPGASPCQPGQGAALMPAPSG